jgi:SAM-dependent methyltransferase
MSSTAGYGEAADTLAEQYESVSFADVHRDVLHLFPTEPSSVLDIGAGTGRDAAALSDLGHRVVAVEPTPQLRAHGQRIHAANDIDWVDDALPNLTVLCKRDQRFNLILLTAVWMHLDPHERSSAMEHISGLLLPEGRVVISLRHGPVPAGRRMYSVSRWPVTSAYASFTTVNGRTPSVATTCAGPTSACSCNEFACSPPAGTVILARPRPATIRVPVTVGISRAESACDRRPTQHSHKLHPRQDRMHCHRHDRAPRRRG